MQRDASRIFRGKRNLSIDLPRLYNPSCVDVVIYESYLNCYKEHLLLVRLSSGVWKNRWNLTPSYYSDFIFTLLPFPLCRCSSCCVPTWLTLTGPRRLEETRTVTSSGPSGQEFGWPLGKHTHTHRVSQSALCRHISACWLAARTTGR